MILLAPGLLLGLLALPVLWWLLRALPPAPRPQSFPPLRLLHGLHGRLREARRAPPWLLLLRLVAVALLVLGLAQPVLVDHRAAATAERGTLWLVIDNGWAAAGDWPARLQAANDALDDAARYGRPVSLLLTAPDRTGASPRFSAAATAGAVRAALRTETPLPWTPDRAAAATALADALRRDPSARGNVLYVSDGVAGPGDAAFAKALRAIGPVERELGAATIARPGRPAVSDGALRLPVSVLPSGAVRTIAVRGETAAGGVLARQSATVPAGAASLTVALALPSELRNQLSRLVLEPGSGAGAVRLLDEGDRRRPVGLLTGSGADTPLLGSLFFLRRALQPIAELREGTLDALLSRPLSVLVAPDGTINGEAARSRIAAFVRGGGTLIRFAGPRLAADTAGADDAGADPTASARPAPDTGETLLPVALLGGARQLGGAMSWSRPEHPAAFGADSPFAGLPVPPDVLVSRQVLAAPDASLASRSWARLADGTPLVTHAALGNGQIVLFHVTSTADWSNLPLSGLFPSMLQRLVQRAVGVEAPADDTVLAPAEILAGDGQFGPPPPAARGLAASAFGRTPASPQHPAGLYGPASARRALNLADAAPPLSAQRPIGTQGDLSGHADQHRLGPALLAAALLLLALDLIVTLALRGLLRPPAHTARRGLLLLVLLMPVLCALWQPPALAQPQGSAAQDVAHAAPAETAPSPGAALETRLAYVVTGDDAVDTVSREGLQGLSRYANARTSARLGQPDGVVPGRDDLAFYPLLYWPVTPQTVRAAPDARWQAALNSFMSHGGILLIDTQGIAAGTSASGGDSGYVPVTPGTRQALRLATGGLDIPPLETVPSNHVLNRTFYLLHGMPGRYSGAPVWAADAEDAGNDGVSPVIIGGNDWAAAWATDESGGFPFATIPGGEDQRTQAYRFGVNLVIYALTGNYKSDQVHVPALLKRLGQAADSPDEGGQDTP